MDLAKEKYRKMSEEFGKRKAKGYKDTRFDLLACIFQFPMCHCAFGKELL